MTHKGGKKAKRAFKRAKGVPKRLKENIEDLTPANLQALLIFIRALLASTGSRRHTGKTKHHKSRKLSVGVHRHVKVGRHFRDVRVLASGKWRFMKG